MQVLHSFFLHAFMVAFAISLSSSFNIDMTDPDVYPGEQKDFFGYKVLQFISGTNKGIIVTAPLHRNGSGRVCRPDKNKNTKCFSSKDTSLNGETVLVKHLGLSIAADSTNSQFTVCSPSVAHECYQNSYLNSVCYKITEQLQQISYHTPAFQKCTKKTVDLVFLFDGSGSMTEDEFKENKAFIRDIMDSLKNTSIQFAAVQFSTNHRKVFDFNDYQAGTALVKLEKESPMGDLTNTHAALIFVLENIMKNASAGASRDATKVLVLITDGDPSDGNKKRIIERYNENNVIRFVIAVKAAKLDKFQKIASQPTNKYAFKIEDYNGLTGILETFQQNIFKMEGTSVMRGGDMTIEMSQSGFSAAFRNDTMVLGSVGTKSWQGSLQELHDKQEAQIEDPHMQPESYMGYSVAVGDMDNTPLYFTGAPRFNHIGQVIVFKHDTEKWITTQKLNGDQIGSYFGAELCSVDIDADGNTDFLLVGAPLFYQAQEKREGQVYVYTLTDKMELKSELNVSAPSIGRFGATISSLTDLNGDELQDIAIGAPLEDDYKGVVYIYLGDRQKGIRSTFSQRITGQEIDPGLRFFGQAIDGGLDLGDDRLPDIVIGSQGTVVVLRSRPVFNVMAHLAFQPREISPEEFDCFDKTDKNLPIITLTVCFEMTETTKSKAEEMGLGLNMSYMLNVDPMRQTYRGFFENDRKTRSLTSSYELRDRETCFNYTIYMQKCVTDTLTPVSIKLTFSQVDKENASAVLNVDSRSQAVVEVPFKKQCAKKDTCIAELEVDFNFTTQTLLVAEHNYINVSVKLSNHGDDSYNTSLTMYYPPGLSFSTMTLTEATRPTLHICHDLHNVFDKTICSISLPVYRSKTAATFKASFYIMNDYNWNDTVSMTITGRSDNTNITLSNSLTKSIPVQFEVKMVVTVRDYITNYLNFTADDDQPKKMEIIYEIANSGFKAFPVNVSLLFPAKLDHNFEMKNYRLSVQQNKTQCSVDDIKPKCFSPENHCQVITCDTFILEKEATTEFIFSGDVQFKDLKKRAENIAFLKQYTGDSAEVKFKSLIQVMYDRERYVLDSCKEKKDGFMQKSPEQTGSGQDSCPTMKWAEVRVEFLIQPNQLLIILTGFGVGMLLVIIITIVMFKLGCFKRKKYYEDEEEDTALQPESPTDSNHAPQNGTIDQSETEDTPEKPPEEKILLS